MSLILKIEGKINKTQTCNITLYVRSEQTGAMKLLFTDIKKLGQNEMKNLYIQNKYNLTIMIGHYFHYIYLSIMRNDNN